LNSTLYSRRRGRSTVDTGFIVSTISFVGTMPDHSARFNMGLPDAYVSLAFSGTAWPIDVGPDAAFVRLSKAHPDVVWTNSPIRIDIDCDGNADYAFLAQTPSSAFVGLVRGKPKSVVAMLKFEASPGSQGGLYYLPAIIEVESLDYDPTDAVGPLPGFFRSQSCTGSRISGGECDSFHFYWDKRTSRLSWWRL
jgi:hypothetical protein